MAGVSVPANLAHTATRWTVHSPRICRVAAFTRFDGLIAAIARTNDLLR